MGNLIARFLSFAATRDSRILMVGLYAAGKTTILYRLKLGDAVDTIPTIGFNVETVEYKRHKFTVWDVGRHARILYSALWRHYFLHTDGIIFVVDSTDEERITEAKEELWSMMNEFELQDAHLLVLANKQDLPQAVSPIELYRNYVMSIASLTDALGLHEIKTRKWYIQSTCAVNGSGIHEGLDWLSQVVSSSPN